MSTPPEYVRASGNYSPHTLDEQDSILGAEAMCVHGREEHKHGRGFCSLLTHREEHEHGRSLCYLLTHDLGVCHLFPKVRAAVTLSAPTTSLAEGTGCAGGTHHKPTRWPDKRG